MPSSVSKKVHIQFNSAQEAINPRVMLSVYLLVNHQRGRMKHISASYIKGGNKNQEKLITY